MNFIKVIGTTISGIARSIMVDPDGRVEVPYEGVITGRQTVATAGTRVQLTTRDIPVGLVMLIGETDNTGTVTYGGSQVVDATATRRGQALTSGQASQWVPVSNLNKIWLDSSVNGDGITYVALR